MCYLSVPFQDEGESASDLGELDPTSLFLGPEKSVALLDCGTPSMARVVESTASFGSESDFDRHYNNFYPPPSAVVTDIQQGPAMITLDDTDDVSLLFNRTKSDTLHLRARERLNDIIAKGSFDPLPITVPKNRQSLAVHQVLRGDSVRYKYRDGLPYLMYWHLSKTIELPVDKDLVEVAMDGEHFNYFINVPSYKLTDFLRTFIMAGCRFRPKPKPPTEAALSLELNNIMTCNQVRKHTSLVPMATSKNKLVESNALLREELFGLMGKVQQDPHFHVPVLDVDITSSNTGISQYLRAFLLNWSKMTHPQTNLQLLLKPDVD